MQVKARIDKIFETMEIHVCNKEMNQEVTHIICDIDQMLSSHITGSNSRGDKYVLTLHQVTRFYAEGQKVMAQDEIGTYSISEKLYHLEEKLDPAHFIRISKSEIVNLKKIKKLDMSLSGTIKVIMVDGTQTYTSRRNVTRLKKALGLG